MPGQTLLLKNPYLRELSVIRLSHRLLVNYCFKWNILISKADEPTIQTNSDESTRVNGHVIAAARVGDAH